VRKVRFPQTIDTDRLRLRKPRADDAQRIFDAYAQDRDVTWYLVWTPHTSLETTIAFVADALARWGHSAFPYVITRKSDDNLLGMIEVRLDRATASFGYVLAKPYWGAGLMTEAVTAVTRMALAERPITRVEAVCDVENAASARVLEKAGLSFERRVPKYVVHPNISPEPRDALLYAVTSDSARIGSDSP
jgi:ribosomal-protein-alanine N-acetyltransferase